jgi:hypothetical protein
MMGGATVLAPAAMGAGKSIQQLLPVHFFRARCTESFCLRKVYQRQVARGRKRLEVYVEGAEERMSVIRVSTVDNQGQKQDILGPKEGAMQKDGLVVCQGEDGPPFGESPCQKGPRWVEAKMKPQRLDGKVRTCQEQDREGQGAKQPGIKIRAQPLWSQ